MVYTDKMKKFILDNYKKYLIKDLTVKFNECFNTSLSRNAMASYMKRHGLKNGLTYIPAYRWKKGTCGKGLEKTWFKKGSLPPNYRAVGSERITKDGYIEVKVETNVWELKHRHIWEKVNGKIPKGHTVIFLDQNKLNTDISNLKLVSRAELLIMNRHKLTSENPELTEMGTNVAKLIIKQGLIEKER